MKIFKKIALSNKYVEKLIQNLINGDRVVDLLLFCPHTYENLQFANENCLAVTESEVLIEVGITEHVFGMGGFVSRRSPYKIYSRTKNDEVLVLLFFAGKSAIWQNIFKIGQTYTIQGKVSKTGQHHAIVHPKVVKTSPNIQTCTAESSIINPKYHLSGNLSQASIKNAISKYIQDINEVSELDNIFDKSYDFINSIHNIHSPKSFEEAENARQVLAFYEIFSRDFAYLIAAQKYQNVTSSIGFETKNALMQKCLNCLPFKLTAEQSDVMGEILADQKLHKSVTRLLQGDVGSGKSIVAFLSVLNAVEAGFQGVIMAPTFILADQLYRNFKDLCDKLGVSIVFISGKDKIADKRKKLQLIADGNVQVIVGTHALFSENVIFKNIGYIVIDEQHRFGIKQRLSLIEKSQGAKCLMMSATPIPRTLSMALYGAIEVSYIKHKPPGRMDIETSVISLAKLNDVTDAVKRKVAEGDRIYWVCGAIDENEESNLTSIAERLEFLTKHFGEVAVSVMHGKMKETERERQMASFASGETQIMLATTVIEVGVNVPEATLIVIENAENFGLATLHQLRGRVGRGSKQSYCFLMYKFAAGDIAKRLAILKSSNDGFKIAERDMELRGSGSTLGRLQSGFEDCKFFNAECDEEIATDASVNARKIFESDAELLLQKHKFIKCLLEIYRYDEYVKYFSS